MKEFTFCSFTYNQEQLITQQLESIKYQINTFGKEIRCSYLLADDHSTDSTVRTVEDWLEKNSSLFDSVRLCVADRNQGIVRNYENALNNIATDCFKIMAGDDLYFRNNVFSAYDSGNFIISPMINMLDDGTVVNGYYSFIRKLIMCGDSSERIKRFMIEQFRYGEWIPAPGVFIKKNLADEGLFEALKPFSWIEDSPEFNYLAGSEKSEAVIISTPLVVYRTDSGISTKANKPNPRYKNDEELLKKTIRTRVSGLPRIIDPYHYMKAVSLIPNYVRAALNKEVNSRLKEFDLNMRREEAQAAEYIRMIMDAAKVS